MTNRARLMSALAAALALVSPLGAAASQAQEDKRKGNPVEFDALVEVRAVESDIDFDQGEEIDSSGIGARARFGAELAIGSQTEIRAEGEARIFSFRGSARDTLESFVARLQITHQASEKLQLRAYARRYENIAVLEAFQADQTSLGARVQWQEGDDRLRVTGEYRTREYDTTIPASGEGYLLSAQYNRRIGPYHWFRIAARTERMQSDDATRRSYSRQIAAVRYSLPVAKRLRVRPAIEYRQWDYDTRIARGDPLGDLREDSYVAPILELAWGRDTRGLYASASAEYRFRTSNDIRYDEDAVRLGVRVGYRF